jgi:tetratricopeptide (TPR) repeat protein
MYLLQGKQGEAASRVRKALSIAPDESEALCWAGDIELFSGNTEQAEQHYERAMELSSPDFLTYGCISLGTRLAHVYRKTGRQEQSETLLGQGLEIALKSLEDLNELADIPYEIAAINAIQGKREEAFQWIQKAIDSGWRDYRMASIDPVFADVREGKQFKEMMAAVKATLDEMLKQVQTE